MVRRIHLSQGKIALIDADDYARISVWKWHYHKKPSDPSGYARRYIPGERNPRKVAYMHNEVLGVKRVDHRNHDTLDNRKKNLRAASNTQQTYNRRAASNKESCAYKGVSYTRDRNGEPIYCIARITANGVRIYLGVFPDAVAAAMAYDKAAIELHGEFACLNFPRSITR